MFRTHLMKRAGRKDRRGLCLALVALLLPVLIGVTALSTDLGVVAVAGAQLKTVADAAALAGAKQLADPNRATPGFDLTNDIARARQRALAIGQANTVLGESAVLLDNSLNLPGGDVIVGYYVPKSYYEPNPVLDTSAASIPNFNTVQVTARRVGDHGGVVPPFFSRIFGFTGTPLNVTSTASVQLYPIQGFKCGPSGFTHLIPIALSQTVYNQMLSKTTADNFAFRNGVVTLGPDGLYESSIYADNAGPGNWGTVKIGVSNNSTSVLAAQIISGVTVDQICTASGGSGSLTADPSFPLALGGNPGISLGIKSALQTLLGKVVVVPIYDPNQSGGDGNNYNFTIVKFASVVVVATDFAGVNSGVIVQPAALVTSDPSIIVGDTPQTDWSNGGVTRLRLSQ